MRYLELSKNGIIYKVAKIIAMLLNVQTTITNYKEKKQSFNVFP